MGIFDLFEKIKKSTPQQEHSVNGIQYLLVGLGNPEQKYEKTRHNAGFMAVDAIAQQKNTQQMDQFIGYSTKEGKKFQAKSTPIVLNGVKCLLLKPLTYMNHSGLSVAQAMKFYHLSPEQLIVLFDDISLEVGQLRLRRKGSHGGHNGIKNIVEQCGFQSFARIKIGVGHPPHTGYDLADWVLSRFRPEEWTPFQNALKDCVTATTLIVTGKMDQAMNQFNAKV